MANGGQVYKPYTIYLHNWDTTSGGIRVMHGLYGWLLQKGQVIIPNAQWSIDSIGIYPEIINGNPLNATSVVRYILQKPGMMTTNGIPGPTEFDPEDHLYYFSRLFGKAKDLNHYMFLPIINTHLFKDQKKLRNKVAYFPGKGKDLKKHPADAILIDRNIAEDQGELADLLNECHTMYCYDPLSAMMEVARLAGVKIRYYGDYPKEELKQYEPGMNGITYWDEEEVPLYAPGFEQHYRNLKRIFSGKLDIFIESTQS